jgi:hypothetical protein
MKTKISSLTVINNIFSKILPSEIIYIISKYHGRWIKLNVPRPMKVKVREPRDKRTRKKHLVSHYYL